MTPKTAEFVTQLIRSDPLRWELLGHVRSLKLPDCWIGAGFVRNAVWHALHSTMALSWNDVDIVWFDPERSDEILDRKLESALRSMDASTKWSVKNQARMHIRNGDEPYASTADALCHWCETATAVAVRRTASDDCELLAPFGLDDLLGLKLRPAGVFATRKRAIFDERVRSKRWLINFPKLELVA